VRWDRFGLDMLKDVVTCVGGAGLACMCQCLAEDYAAWISGLPDLLLWNTKMKQARLVEVKGPTDSLSQQQRAWLRIMCISGLDAFVAKVGPSKK
jgi:fanconi-associated nuclease 1